ncbi:MAG TPA: hypothetical protein EYN66_05595, partial [Myxococcales bacterium]|nr:hypothetical protein [Myxococcales bacterium]
MNQTGQCHEGSPRIHPFVHVMLHAHAGPLELPLNSLDPWLRVWLDLRGSPLGWSLTKVRSTSEEVEGLVSWVKSQPSLLSWFLSDSAFRAPPDWPTRVSESFSPLPVVTPWEYANACPPLPPGGGLRIWMSHQASILWCYSAGMSVELLARHLCIPADSVEREMVRALKVLKKHGPFVLWSLDLDDEYEDVAAGLCFPLMLRLEMHQWVLKDVLRAPRSVFEPLMRNGKFWQRLRGGR